MKAYIYELWILNLFQELVPKYDKTLDFSHLTVKYCKKKGWDGEGEGGGRFRVLEFNHYFSGFIR